MKAIRSPFCVFVFLNAFVVSQDGKKVVRSDRLEQAVCLFLCVEPDESPSLLHEKHSAVVERGDRKGVRQAQGERERESPSSASLEITTKEGDGGRVNRADCLESNKTRRLREAGSSFGSLD